MAKNSLDCLYDIGDIVLYFRNHYCLVVDILNPPASNVSVYKMLNLKTGVKQSWFIPDVDRNSEFIA